MSNVLVRRALPGALVSAAVLLAGPGPALAHTVLLSTDPAAGAQLAAPPEQVRLQFSEDVDPRLARVAVGAGGEPREVPVTVSGATVLAEVPDGGAGGSDWQVSYRVLSADGHPVSGSVAFTVLPPTPPSTDVMSPTTPADVTTPAAAAVPSPVPEPDLASDESSTVSSLWPWAAGGAVLLGAGYWAVRRRGDA